MKKLALVGLCALGISAGVSAQGDLTQNEIFKNFQKKARMELVDKNKLKLGEKVGPVLDVLP